MGLFSKIGDAAKLVPTAFGPWGLATATGVSIGIEQGLTRKNKAGEYDWTRAADTGLLATEAVGIGSRLFAPKLTGKAELSKSMLVGGRHTEHLLRAGYSNASEASQLFGMKLFGSSIGPVELFSKTGGAAIGGFLGGLSAFGNSKHNTSNVQAGLYTGAVAGGAMLLGELRHGRALARLGGKDIKNRLPDVGDIFGSMVGRTGSLARSIVNKIRR